MAAAADRQLALALVHQRFEDGDDLTTREAALEAALRETGDARVERFGDLTFGVFLRGPIEQVEEWVGRAHAHLNRADAAPVAIGVAYLASHHDAPDALRADATDALQESYESGQPVLVG